MSKTAFGDISKIATGLRWNWIIQTFNLPDKDAKAALDKEKLEFVSSFTSEDQMDTYIIRCPDCFHVLQ